MTVQCNQLGIPSKTGNVWVKTDIPDGIQYPYWNGTFWGDNPDLYNAISLPTLEDYDAALTNYLDVEAQSKHYSDRISCSVRAGYTGPFQAEGIAFAQWMDTCNAIGYQMLADFQSGLIAQPSVEEMLAALPPMQWP